MEREQAEAFTAEHEARLKLRRDQIAERNDAEEQLIGQFVPKNRRGQFKLELLRAKEIKTKADKAIDTDLETGPHQRPRPRA